MHTENILSFISVLFLPTLYHTVKDLN
uniref:Uncharacterized protein n=1 Tax=Anguilla anguilla TaxID=7936 RepID=A0A0E9TJ26_ANGAN